MVGEISVQNVSKSFMMWKAGLKVRVIDNLEITISEGELVLLLGPNGSGKSTLLRMIGTLLMPSSGNIVVYGHNTKRRSRSLLNMIGFMPEECKFHAGISGLNFLCYLGNLMGIKSPKKKATRLLKQFGLEKWSYVDVSVYSEGMRQRIGLCSAVLNEPKVLLLDEPYANLDDQMKQYLEEYLKNYTEKGNIAIAASHEKAHFTNYRKIHFPVQRES
ncbi:MAG: ATP-binding cassette domain-containing protein [Candidatus Hodarchaeota archaeon]